MMWWLPILLLCWQGRGPEEPAQAALARAMALRGEWRAAPAAQQPALREQALEAFRSVRRQYPFAREVCAEASFRAGELLRAAGDADAARREWLIAADQPPGITFRDRARLELAHLDRRAGRLESALQLLSQIELDPLARSALREEAAHWCGAIEQSRGRMSDARRAWRRLALMAEDPLVRIRAYDRMALTWLEESDLEAAAGVIEECRRACAELALEETRTGERVRTALATMRTLELLPGLIAQRRRRQE
jgi:tetratricopeptide (TPR) repeat protein